MSFLIGPDGQPVLVGTEPQPGWDREKMLGAAEQEQLLRGMVETNRTAKRASAAQRFLDRTIQACLDEGEIALGLSLGFLNSARVAGQQNLACQCLLQLLVDLKDCTAVLDRRCRVCGFAEPPGDREWAEFDLCAGCAKEAGHGPDGP